jgi:hypothetical protein
VQRVTSVLIGEAPPAKQEAVATGIPFRQKSEDLVEGQKEDENTVEVRYDGLGFRV